MASKTREVDDFMKGPLVAWISGCLSQFEENLNEPLTYEKLVDGVLLHKFYCRMSIPVPYKVCEPRESEDDFEAIELRARNLIGIMKNIRNYLEYELKYVLLRQPDILQLAKDPRANVAELELLLHLLLGCAVECPENFTYIAPIQQMDETSQKAMLEYVNQFKHQPHVALSSDMLNFSNSHLDNVQMIMSHVRRLRVERDRYRHLGPSANSTVLGEADFLEGDEIDYSGIHETLEHTSMLESADDERKSSREKRKLEQLTVSQRIEIEELKCHLDEDSAKLNDSQQQLAMARGQVKALEKKLLESTIQRLELDDLRNKAARVELYDDIVKSYKEKLEHYQPFKVRVDELTRKNEELLKHQESAKKQIRTMKDSMTRLESQLDALEKKNVELAAENQSCLRREQEYIDLNNRLEFQLRVLKNKIMEAKIESDETPIYPSSFSQEMSGIEKLAFQGVDYSIPDPSRINEEEVEETEEKEEEDESQDFLEANKASLADELAHMQYQKEESELEKQSLLLEIERQKRKVTELEQLLSHASTNDDCYRTELMYKRRYRSELNISLDTRYLRQASELNCVEGWTHYASTNWLAVTGEEGVELQAEVDPLEVTRGSFDWSGLDLNLDEGKILIRMLDEIFPRCAESCVEEVERKKKALFDKIKELLLRLEYLERRKQSRNYDYIKRPFMKFFGMLCLPGARRSYSTTDRNRKKRRMELIRRVLVSESRRNSLADFKSSDNLAKVGVPDGVNFLSEDYDFSNGSYRQFTRWDESFDYVVHQIDEQERLLSPVFVSPSFIV